MLRQRLSTMTVAQHLLTHLGSRRLVSNDQQLGHERTKHASSFSGGTSLTSFSVDVRLLRPSTFLTRTGFREHLGLDVTRLSKLAAAFGRLRPESRRFLGEGWRIRG